MRLLFPDPTYPENEDQMGQFRASLTTEVADSFAESATLHEVDAGPSASIPAYVLQIVSTTADAIAIFAGPAVIAEGYKWWKRNFEKATAFLRSKGLPYTIDAEAAALLAAEHTTDTPEGIGEIRIVSVTRHWMNLNGAGSDYRNWEEQLEATQSIEQFSKPLCAAEETQAHFEAVKQLEVRYLMLVESAKGHFTVVVEGDGTVSGLHSFTS